MKWPVPDTLFTRLFGLVLTAIIISQIMALALIMGFFGDHFPPPPPAVFQQGDLTSACAGAHPAPPHRRPPPPPGFWVSIGAQLLGLTASAWFGAKILAQPIQRLAQAAVQLSDNLHHLAVEETGPAEARQAAQAFNRMQERIRLQLEERGQFLAAVSHDLRTPLTRMKLRIESLEDEATAFKLRGDICEMAAMLDATLDYLRGEAQTEVWQLIDIESLVNALAEDAQELGQDVTVIGGARPLLGQPATLRRCVLNLVENAARYGGEARLTLIDAADRLVIMVRDAGPGIPEARIQEVFKPFFRLESSRNKATGGVGLGLSIAREAARRHGGTLTLENAVGGGLIARLTLPRQG